MHPGQATGTQAVRMADRGPAGHCPACPAASSAEWGVAGSLRLVKCVHCGLVYSDPQPLTEVRTKYEADFDIAAHFDPWSPRKRVLFERLLDRLPRPRPGGDRLLDVGCGDGQFLELAQQRGWKGDGI